MRMNFAIESNVAAYMRLDAYTRVYGAYDSYTGAKSSIVRLRCMDEML